MKSKKQLLRDMWIYLAGMWIFNILMWIFSGPAYVVALIIWVLFFVLWLVPTIKLWQMNRLEKESRGQGYSGPDPGDHDLIG